MIYKDILNRKKRKLHYLKCWDVFLITVIMFSSFIVTSFSTFFHLTDKNMTEIPEFTTALNWQAFIFQVILLGIAFLYLYFRNFDFSQWKITINLKAILIGIILFIGVALLFDLYFMLLSETIFDNSIFYESQNEASFVSSFSNIDVSLLFYSILNGFYEEIFFLGVCLSVIPKKRSYYFIYSLFIRYSFHTYQGNLSAIAIGFLLGSIYYMLYTKMKEKNLFPFFLAHAITDVFGAGIIGYFF